MSRDNGLELKVGSFVLMAVLALTFFIISISDLSILEKGHFIHVYVDRITRRPVSLPANLKTVLESLQCPSL